MSSCDKPFKIYKASAGSGKTFTMVREYLTLCLSENTDVYREILAVTFTNKAAGEMKAKILRNIQGIVECSDKNDIAQMRKYLMSVLNVSEEVLIERAKKLYTSVLHNYSDMAVCTIDSFVQHLSRSFAKELGLPGQYSLILDNDDLVDEIIHRISDELGVNEFITKILSNYVDFNLSEESDWNVRVSLGNFIKKLLKEDAYRKGSYQSYEEIDEEKYNKIKQYLKDKLEDIDKNILLIIKEICDKEDELGISEQDYNGKSRGLPSVKKKISDGKVDLITATVQKILDGDASWKDSKSKIDNDLILDVYRDAIDKYKSLSSGKIMLDSIYKGLYMNVLRNHIFELIKEYISDSSRVHISEFNKRISEILGDCTAPFIYERIGNKYRHYFVDEFQDTSVLQWHNFLPLVDNSLSSGNMNLLVGDAKQSIYRFRSGEVEQIIELPKIYKRPEGAFGQNCERQFVNSACKMSLGTNYRSSKNIIKFNNSFFRYASGYLAMDDVYSDVEQIYNPDNKDGFVSVEVFQGNLKVDEYKEKVKESILKQILDLRSQNIEFKDITILVRSNSDGADIAGFLMRNGIDVVSSDSLLLKASDKVQLVINTLMSMFDDKNPVTKKAVEFYLDKLNISPKPIYADSYSIYDLCMAICKAYSLNVMEDVFLQYFMGMVYDWQNHHSTGISDFLEYWDKKKNELAVQLSGDLNSVQIMSIHKSKGLEFNVVIYPYAKTNLEASHGLTQNERWLNCSDYEETKDIPYLDTFLLKLTKDLKGTTFEPLWEKEKDKTMLDTINLMYVAMTRAKNMLFIYVDDKKAGDDKYNLFTDFAERIPDFKHEPKDTDLDGFDDYFVKKDEISVVEGEETSVYTYGDMAASVLNVVEKSDKKEGVNVLELNPGEQASEQLNWMEKLKPEADPTMFWAEKGTFMPDEWGLLVHEILSKIITIADAERALRPYVNDGTMDEEKAENLLDIFRKITEIPELKDAFSEDAIVKNEMDIHTSDGNILRPDRYVETKNGTILIDYKTGKPDKKYHIQLQNYMTALKAMNGNEEIKAYLVYLDMDNGVWIDKV